VIHRKGQARLAVACNHPRGARITSRHIKQEDENFAAFNVPQEE
jgi:hypothetical protein